MTWISLFIYGKPLTQCHCFLFVSDTQQDIDGMPHFLKHLHETPLLLNKDLKKALSSSSLSQTVLLFHSKAASYTSLTSLIPYLLLTSSLYLVAFFISSIRIIPLC